MIENETKDLLNRIEKCMILLFPEITQRDEFYAAFSDEKNGIMALSAMGSEQIFFYDFKHKKRCFSGLINGVIRAVSFHPDKEIAAVSTLGYGGHSELFGQVYLLNYNTGEIQSVFGNSLSPGVYAASFRPGNVLWIQFSDIDGQCFESEIDLAAIPISGHLSVQPENVTRPEAIIPEPSLEETAAILERIING